MSLSLYAATIPSYLQILNALARLLDTADSYCREKQWAPAEIIQARLAPDMNPFAYQVKSSAVHSLGAIEGVRRGLFSPDEAVPPASFPSLKARIQETLSGLQAIDEAEMARFMGRPMRFAFGGRSIEFAAEDFLLSFAQPNFYFHATTCYDILRWKGVPIGKRDFLGRMRFKR